MHRDDPVRREEVRLAPGGLVFAATPADAWELVSEGHRYPYFEPIATLFEPLLAELPAVQLPKRFSQGCSWLQKDCPRCGRASFIASSHWRGAYCSDHCVALARKAAAQRQTAKRSMERREAREGTICPYCGTTFTGLRSDRRFCSDLCRVRAHRRSPEPSPPPASA
jgi:hypothetical protein